MEQFVKFIKGALPLAFLVAVAIPCISCFGRGAFLTTTAVIALAATVAIVLSYMNGHTFKRKED